MRKYYPFHVIILFVLMLIVYERVAELFGYWGFSYNLHKIRALSSGLILIVTSRLLDKRKLDIAGAFLTFWTLYVIVPIFVLWSADVIESGLILMHMLFYYLCIFSLILRPRIELKSNRFWTLPFVKHKLLYIVISGLFFIPLISVLNNFTLNSFNLKDVYDVRLEARKSGNRLIGYTKEVLARVILPYFLIFAVINKRMLLFIYGVIGIIVVYASTGALKSILAVIPISFLFVFAKDYASIQRRLVYIVYLLLCLPLLETYLVGSYFFTDLPARRLFFVPGLLENAYYLEFNGSPRLYLDSMLSFLNSDPESLTKIVGGKYFGRPEMNANVGVLIDGFINLGLGGVILHGLTVYLIFALINGMKIPAHYFGIFFVFLYYLNTSFLGTLLLTHGLLFLLMFFYIARTKDESTSYYL